MSDNHDDTARERDRRRRERLGDDLYGFLLREGGLLDGDWDEIVNIIEERDRKIVRSTVLWTEDSTFRATLNPDFEIDYEAVRAWAQQP